MAVQQILTADDGGVWRLTRTDAGWDRLVIAPPGSWPCANPVRDLVAVSVVVPGRTEARSNIMLFGPDGHFAGGAYQSPAGAPPVIATRIPHYAMWSPTGETLSFVAAGSEGLSLYLSAADASMTADSIATGAPLFSAWNEDGETIAIHTGQELSLFRPADRSRMPISERAIGFRTPAFIGDRVLYARPQEPGVMICGYDAQTGQESEHGTFAGGVALGRAGRMLSVAVTSQPDSGVFDRLWLLDPSARDESSPSLVAKGPFVAAFWSPDASKAAIVFPTQSGDGRYAVRFVAEDGSPVAATEPFVPAVDFRTMLGFFDQYAYSHPLWSPGSDAFLAVGRVGDDGLAKSFANVAPDYVLLFAAAKGVPVERVCTAEHAFFAPAA